LSDNGLGLYEITVNATVDNPKFYDWGKIFVNVVEGDTIFERLVFTEEFIAENPECVEINELLDESREFLALGDFESSEDKLNEALNSCKETISQQSLFSIDRLKSKFEDKLFIYLLMATALALFLGVGYYSYRTVMFRRALKESSNIATTGGSNYEFKPEEVRKF